MFEIGNNSGMFVMLISASNFHALFFVSLITHSIMQHDGPAEVQLFTILKHLVKVTGCLLTDAARALAKHVNRSNDRWWGVLRGSGMDLYSGALSSSFEV